MPTKAAGNDPYAAIAQPASPAAGDDPYAAIAQPDHETSAAGPSGWSASGAWQGAKEGAGDLMQGFTSLPHAFAHPFDTLDQISAQQSGLQNRAVQDFKSGHYGNAFWHGIDAAVPILGPMDAALTDEYQQGNKAAAMTRGAVNAIPYAFDPVGTARKLAGKGLEATGYGAKAASATGDTLKLRGTRMLTKGSPGQLLQSALKPNVRYGADIANTLQEGIPYALKADPNLQGVSGFARAADTARNAQFGQYDDLIAPYRKLQPGTEGPVRPGDIHGGPIAKAQMLSIPPMDLIEDNPTAGRLRRFEVPDPEGGTLKMGAQEEPRGGIVQRTKQLGEKYNRPMSIPLMDAVREDANAKLNSFYNKAGGDQAAALSNPETARVKAVGDTMRQLLYPELEANAGLEPGTVAKMQSTYGKLADAADIANKREPIYARHDPVTLGQKIAVAHGGPVATAFNFIKEKALNNLTNSDALVNSAVDRYQNPLATPLKPRPGFLPKVTFGVGQGVESTGKAIGNARRVSVPPPVYSYRRKTQ